MPVGHALHCLLGAEHRTDGVDREDALHALEAQILQARLNGQDPGVIDQHIEAAERAVDGREQVGHLAGVRAVGPHGQRPAPQCLHIRHHRQCRGLVGNIADRDVITSRGGQPRGGGAHSTTAAGYQYQRCLGDVVHREYLL